ncbi:hypothetical protein HYDPIDRAFT_120568, partial [Hydnomerulius pinastri MD-312]
MAQGFALLPIIWCLGGTIGPFMGGVLVHPHEGFGSLFSGTFWVHYPYFPPCVVAAAFTALSLMLVFFLLEETLASKRRHNPRRDGYSLAETIDEQDPASNSEEDVQTPFRDLLVPSIMIPIANYAALAFLDIALPALMPLFYSTPLELGGLNFSPPAIGTWMAMVGIADGIFQVLCFEKMIDWLGPKRLFCIGVLSYIPIMTCFPLMSFLVGKTGGVGFWVYVTLAIHLVLILIWDCCHGCIFMFITASAPAKNTLGAINGLGQTTASTVRTIGPAIATSMFAFSKH